MKKRSNINLLNPTGTGAQVSVAKTDGNHITGNFSVSYKGFQTGSVIPYNYTASEVKAALESLHSIPTGTIAVSRTGPDLQNG